MGIKDLWTILGPYCERASLQEIEGKRIAIDLSCWICEAQNVAEYHIQPRMYLRNLYFRTCFLLLINVQPAFILEGNAPTLKYDTIAARNAIQFKGAKPRVEGKTKGTKDRSRFNFTLKLCEEMLKYIGLTCVKGKGEAEAMCAYLDAENLVDGCISQDSDCFAYGAQVVYRNFSITLQGGTVDVYDIGKINKKLDFGRNKIVALALLCGSDYSDGVHGIGKDSAMKFFQHIEDVNVLDHMRAWRKNGLKYEEMQRRIDDKNICTACGHYGKVQIHNKKGCLKCSTSIGCKSELYKEEYANMKNEVNIRSKALIDPQFPDENLIDEFLIRKDQVENLHLKWKMPDMINFVKFTSKYLEWEEIYAFGRLLPILTRWQLLHYKSKGQAKGLLSPSYIKKIRNPKGISSYEIIWEDCDKVYEKLIPEEQLASYADATKLWSTIEPQDLVREAYPDLVMAFEKSKVKPKKAATKRKKAIKKTPLQNIENMLANTSISDNAELDQKKMKLDTRSKTDIYTLDKYLMNPVVNNLQNSSTPKRGNIKNGSFNVNVSLFEDDDLDENLSLIVEDIISKKPVNLFSQSNTLNVNKANETSFFMDECNANCYSDVFEQSVNNIINISSEDSDSDNDEIVSPVDEIEPVNDTFEICMAPLLTRIKN